MCRRSANCTGSTHSEWKTCTPHAIFPHWIAQNFAYHTIATCGIYFRFEMRKSFFLAHLPHCFGNWFDLVHHYYWRLLVHCQNGNSSKKETKVWWKFEVMEDLTNGRRETICTFGSHWRLNTFVGSTFCQWLLLWLWVTNSFFKPNWFYGVEFKIGYKCATNFPLIVCNISDIANKCTVTENFTPLCKISVLMCAYQSLTHNFHLHTNFSFWNVDIILFLQICHIWKFST